MPQTNTAEQARESEIRRESETAGRVQEGGKAVVREGGREKRESGHSPSREIKVTEKLGKRKDGKEERGDSKSKSNWERRKREVTHERELTKRWQIGSNKGVRQQATKNLILWSQRILIGTMNGLTQRSGNLKVTVVLHMTSHRRMLMKLLMHPTRFVVVIFLEEPIVNKNQMSTIGVQRELHRIHMWLKRMGRKRKKSKVKKIGSKRKMKKYLQKKEEDEEELIIDDHNLSSDDEDPTNVTQDGDGEYKAATHFDDFDDGY